MTRSATATDLPRTRILVAPAGAAPATLAVLDVAARGADHGPVLLVPGHTGSKEDFLPLLDGLAAAGYRTVAVDQRGQFESEGADDESAYTPRALARDLPLLCAALGLDRPHLVGHSFGGLVARAAVLADPGAWRSLTLLDSGPAALVGSRADAVLLLSQAVRTRPLDEVFDAVEGFYAAIGRTPLEQRQADFGRLRFTRTRAAAHAGIGVALTAEPDLVDELAAAARSVALPVTVMYGERDDAWTPAEQRAMAGRLGARVVVVPGAAHSPAWEAPQATLQALLGVIDPA